MHHNELSMTAVGDDPDAPAGRHDLAAPRAERARRICFVTTIAASLNVMYEGQLEFLRDRGHRLTLVCGGEASEIDKLRARNLGDVVPVPLVRPPRPLRDLRALLRLTAHFARHRYDVVIVTTPKAILLGILAASITRQPCRIVFFQGRVYENFTGLLRAFYVGLDRLSSWLAHRTLFVSPSLMRFYGRDGRIFLDRGEVVGPGSVNGVSGAKYDPARFDRTQREAIRAEHGLGPRDFVVVVIGRFCLDKGLRELEALTRRAAEHDPRFRFVLVGWVEDETGVLFEQVRARANVRYVGVTSAVERFLAIADVHLFLSHREGFGNVAIEAAAMGVPTIAYEVVGVMDSVCDGVSGIRVPFGDVDRAWAALCRIADERDQGVVPFPDARHWALRTFGREAVWRRYERLYLGAPGVAEPA